MIDTLEAQDAEDGWGLSALSGVGFFSMLPELEPEFPSWEEQYC